MDLTIGAPVFERAWILDKWFLALEEQIGPDDRVTIIFNDGGSTDGTLELIDEWSSGPWDIEMIDSSDDGSHLADRLWSPTRYEMMAHLRNQILHRVREIGPDFHWSHDTDIIAAPGTLERLIAGQVQFDGTAPTVYMTKHSTLNPNSMRLMGGQAKRMIPQGGGFVRVGVAFASVLMNPALYAVDYAPHEQGEDIGWGLNAQKAGLSMAVAPDCKCKHVMLREQADKVDPRVGF